MVMVNVGIRRVTGVVRTYFHFVFSLKSLKSLEPSGQISILPGLPSPPSHTPERPWSGALVFEHATGALDPVPQPILEPCVLLPILDVLRNGRANDLGDRLVIDRGDRLKLLGLLGGQSDGHGLGRFHSTIVPQ